MTTAGAKRDAKTIAPDAPPSRRRGQYRNGIRQREKILATATEIFGRRGYAGGSLRQIATEVGVSPAAILLHFDSKEGLLMAVLEHWTARSIAEHRSLRGVAYLRSLIELMRRHQSERGFVDLFTTLATEANDPEHPAHDLMVQRYRSLVERIATELVYARENGEIRDVDDEVLRGAARRVIAAMDGLQIQWLLDSELDLAGDFAQFVEDLLSRLS